MNHGLKITDKILYLILPDDIEVDMVVVNGEIYSRKKETTMNDIRKAYRLPPVPETEEEDEEVGDYPVMSVF